MWAQSALPWQLCDSRKHPGRFPSQRAQTSQSQRGHLSTELLCSAAPERGSHLLGTPSTGLCGKSKHISPAPLLSCHVFLLLGWEREGISMGSHHRMFSPCSLYAFKSSLMTFFHFISWSAGYLQHARAELAGNTSLQMKMLTRSLALCQLFNLKKNLQKSEGQSLIRCEQS